MTGIGILDGLSPKARQMVESRDTELRRLIAARDIFRKFIAQLIVEGRGASLNGNVTICKQPFPASLYDAALAAANSAD